MVGNNMSHSCPFCRGIEKERLIYAGDLFLVFQDYYPVNPGHTLIVPKRHITELSQLTIEERLRFFELVEKMIKILKEVLHPEGFNIGLNIGKVAGQTIEHIHFHIIPRYEGDTPDPRGGLRKVITGIWGDRTYWREKWTKNRLSCEKIEQISKMLSQELKNEN